ncbi:MAG TPA: hypothetical protein VLJ37_09430 [bacterium]|nr:hypothetical protein [bacterium]
METRGISLLNNKIISFDGWPESLPAASGGPVTGDEYVGARATVAANHESLRTPGTAPNAAVVKQIEEIADNPALSDKQKRATINDLRKQLGISKGDMKKLYMKPLEQKAAQEGDEAKRKLYASMYKPGGCVKKVFKGIGKGLAVGAKVAAGVASAMVNPANLIPMGVSLISKIPGVSKATRAVEGAVDQVTGWADKGMGYVQRGVQFSKDLASIFGNFGGRG